MGLGEIIEVVTQVRYNLPHFIRADVFFPPCGTMFSRSLTLARHVAMPQALDVIVMMEMSRSRGLVSTRSPSQARAQNEE